MKVKIDTKERFHVISMLEHEITAIMTAELHDCLKDFLQNDVKNIILNLKDTHKLETAAAMMLLNLQQEFYAQKASFVICCLQPAVEQYLDQQMILERINYTPTESEAWDIIQMEEIERELFGDEEL